MNYFKTMMCHYIRGKHGDHMWFGMYESRSCPTVDRLLTPSVDNNGMLKDYEAFPGLHF